ncbi:MAG: alanine racemase, partial [Acidimicrobiia bacterium]
MAPVLTNETTGPHYRPAWAEVDLDAIRHNTAVLVERAAPARLMAVVKADGYGHGAVAAALAALESGATWLGVALVEEGIELREAGIEAPILLLSEPPSGAADVVVHAGLTPVVYTRRFIDALAKVAADAGRVEPLPVHLKVDTGMHRVGCEPAEAGDLARGVRRHQELVLEGLLTHLAAADDPAEEEFTAGQLRRFEAVRAELARARIRPPVVHAANSAGLLSELRARFSLVRCGIALYGIPPAPALAGTADLRPALSLRAKVASVRRLGAGERISYGLRYRLESDSAVAVVPLGYADGV